jgi:tRNA(Ile)-lysidine synthase
MPATDPNVAAAIGSVRHDLPRLASAPGPIVVGCSGGADSVALLGLLTRAIGPGGRPLVAVHVDHGLRPESAADATHVARVCDRLGVAFVGRRLDLAEGAGLPARARHARYAALWEVADAQGATVLALGHTATDQAETILLHLCRGAGLDGLSGMRGLDAAPGRTTGRLWRPLLAFDRATVRRMCEALSLPFVDDPTNEDALRPRTRIRHQVLPQLRAIRKGVDLALARAARIVGEADDALAQLCTRELAARRRGAAGVTMTYATDGWADVPIAIRQRVLQRICADAGVATDRLPMRTIRSIDATLARGGGEAHSWDLHPNVRLMAVRAQLWLEGR